MGKDTNEDRDIRVRKAPAELHLKIEHYMFKRGLKGKSLTKELAVIELLEKATKPIKLPTTK
jgi:hypothetical protein